MEFSGFGAEGLAFLAGLRDDNTRSYFDAHRDDYQHGLLEPAKAFVEAFGAAVRAEISRAVVSDPRVNGSIYRINRDTRFSKDKTPYRTRMTFTLWEGSRRHMAPSFWLGFDDRTVGFGAGMHGLERERLRRYRIAVAATVSGAALEAAIIGAAKHGATVSEPKYKRVPAGFDRDHVRSDLLRHAGLSVHFEDPTPRSIASARFVDWCVRRLDRLAPVHRWFVSHVG